MSTSYGIIAKRYARALFDSYDHQALATINSGLKVMADAWNSSIELRRQLLNPACPNSERNDVLKSLSNLAVPGDEQFSNFFILLADNKRLEALPSISSSFNSLLEALKREISLIVTSAVPLSPDEKSAFERTAADKFGTLVSVQWKENPEKIGGMVVQVGDKVLDGSVKGVLEKLKETLVH